MKMCLILLVFLPFFSIYIFARLTRGINRSNTCLVGKTAIITGANSGLGYQTALNLASRGCKVIMADVEDMEGSRTNIIKHTNNTNIHTKKIDLGSLKSVRIFASDILKSEERLDILVNNAGIGASAKKKTEDGLHPVMQINYFGHFLLTHLLIELLKKSAPSRIIFTSSIIAFVNNLSPINLNFEVKSESVFEDCWIYGNSKLAAIVASDIFAQKLEGTGVTSNAVHPGLVATPIFPKCYAVRRNLVSTYILKFIILLFAKDSWEGSQTLVHTAVSKKLEKVTGKYFSDCRIFIKPLSAYNKEWCKDIWEASENLVSLTPNEKI